MGKLFYTVEKQTQDIDGIEKCTGWKTIRVYEIVNDQPHFWFDLETLNDSSEVGGIENWLVDNGFGDRNYEFELIK